MGGGDGLREVPAAELVVKVRRRLESRVCQNMAASRPGRDNQLLSSGFRSVQLLCRCSCRCVFHFTWWVLGARRRRRGRKAKVLTAFG